LGLGEENYHFPEGCLIYPVRGAEFQGRVRFKVRMSQAKKVKLSVSRKNNFLGVGNIMTSRRELDIFEILGPVESPLRYAKNTHVETRMYPVLFGSDENTFRSKIYIYLSLFP
jgi:hypothetical protein